MPTSESSAGDPVFDREIRQIIPAPGYGVIFFDEDDGDPWAESLVGWALVAESPGASGEPQPRPSVIGLVADGKSVLLADEFPNFVGYLSPEGGLDDWREDVRKAWDEHRDHGSTRKVDHLPRALQRKKSW